MPPIAFPIPVRGTGRLFIGPKPDPENLDASIEAWKSLGIDTVLSLLDGEEARALGLMEEAARCRANGMTFLSQPTADFSVPPTKTLNRLAQTVLDRMADDASVLVHCRAGIGRSGMTACTVLIRQGLSAEDAILAVSGARGKPVPDTSEQADLLRRVAEMSSPGSEVE